MLNSCHRYALNKAASYVLTPSALYLVIKYLIQQAKIYFPP